MPDLWWTGLSFDPREAENDTDVHGAITEFLTDRTPVSQVVRMGRYTVHAHRVLEASVAADIFDELGGRIGFGIWSLSEESARAFLPVARILLTMMGIVGEPSVYTLYYQEAPREAAPDGHAR